VEAILAHERETGTCFAGVVLHDSEDVLHPLELKYFNRLLPRNDMVQLPVASLERKWGEFVAGTYMDEFAESHKEMVVRERLTGSVPSAGVGTCFSRRALVALVGATRNQPFNTASLTEDYEIGMRLAQMGMRSVFGWIELPVGGSDEPQPLTVREFFPDNFKTAVRQKSRWVLGIGLQSWRHIPLRGRTAKLKYLLLHDRKGVVTSFISILAYVVLLQYVLLHVAVATTWLRALPSALEAGPWLDGLLATNLAFFAARLGHRYYFTGRLYGLRQAMLAWPRMIVGNFVNCFAVARAWRLYLAHVVLGRRLAWDKTMHDYPAPSQLGRARQRLGELLLSWQALPEAALQQALDQQRQQKGQERLGKLLLAAGVVDEEVLADAIAYQADLPRGVMSAAATRSCLSRVLIYLALRHRFVPLGITETGKVLIGVSACMPAERLKEIATATGMEPLQRILRDSEIGPGLEFLFQDDSHARLRLVQPHSGQQAA